MLSNVQVIIWVVYMLYNATILTSVGQFWAKTVVIINLLWISKSVQICTLGRPFGYGT